jgi:uncharacterized protein
MKTLRFFTGAVLLALFSIHPVQAQQLPAPAAHHCLWEIKGSSNVVYLLGSIHLLNRTNYPLAQPILTAFTNSAIAVFETDIAKLDDPEVQQRILARAILPPGHSLPEELSPALYASFSNHVATIGLPLGMFDQFTPAMAAMTIEVVEMTRLGAQPEYGVDQYFFRRARKAGMKIVPLETVDFQIDLVTTFTRREGEQLLKATLEEIDSTKKVLGDMIVAWQTGDGAKLESLLNEAMREEPVLFKRLVTDRSRRWVPTIESLLRGDRNAFVVVGAGHLVGSQGVIELLRKDGWKVTQL